MTIENPGLKIRVLREIKGYTQENMATELQISGKAYQKIESGETQLSISRLNQISKILEHSVIEILSFDESNIFENRKSKPEKVAPVTNVSIPDNNPIVDSKNDLIKNLQKEVKFLKKVVTKNMSL